MGKYIFGIILILVGAVMVIKSEALLKSFGRIAWAEEKLGSEGGTRLFYKLIGILLIVLSFLIMTDTLQGWFIALFT